VIGQEVAVDRARGSKPTRLGRPGCPTAGWRTNCPCHQRAHEYCAGGRPVTHSALCPGLPQHVAVPNAHRSRRHLVRPPRLPGRHQSWPALFGATGIDAAGPGLFLSGGVSGIRKNGRYHPIGPALTTTSEPRFEVRRCQMSRCPRRALTRVVERRDVLGPRCAESSMLQRHATTTTPCCTARLRPRLHPGPPHPRTLDRTSPDGQIVKTENHSAQQPPATRDVVVTT
jgi:hypothetical protein